MADPDLSVPADVVYLLCERRKWTAEVMGRQGGVGGHAVYMPAARTMRASVGYRDGV